MINNNITKSTDIDLASISYNGIEYNIEGLFLELWFEAHEQQTDIISYWKNECDKVTFEQQDEETLYFMAEDDKAYNNIRDFRLWCGYSDHAFNLAEIFKHVLKEDLLEILKDKGINLISALRIVYRAATNYCCGYGCYTFDNQGWGASSIKSIEIYEGEREDLMKRNNACFYEVDADRTIVFSLDCGWEHEEDMFLEYV